MSDPVMRQILEQMQKDPASIQKHMENPEIQRKIAKLADSGILQVRWVETVRQLFRWL